MLNKLHIENIRAPQSSNSGTIDIPGISLETGEALCIVGKTGTGKSAIARILAGVATEKESTGVLNLSIDRVLCNSEISISAAIGYIPSQPQLCFSGIRSTVRGELGLSLELIRNLEIEEYLSEILDIAKEFDIVDLLDRDPFTLSGGETVRAVIALTLIKQPKFLVIDDCLKSLAFDTLVSIQAKLFNLVERKELGLIQCLTKLPRNLYQYTKYLTLLEGRSAIVGPEDIVDWVSRNSPMLLNEDYFLTNKILSQLKITPQRFPETLDDLKTLLHKLDIQAPPILREDQRLTIQDECTYLEVSQFSFSYKDSNFTLGPLDLKVCAGQSIAITGPNGAGKTTLLMSLGHLLKGQSGEIALCSPKTNTTIKPSKKYGLSYWAHHVLYAFQDPDNQLYLPSVKAELTDIAKNCDVPVPNENLEVITDCLGLSQYYESSPLDIPRSIKRLVAIGAVFLASPTVILLDEPTVDLDQEQISSLINLIQKFIHGGGIVIFVSHDINFVSELASDIWEVEGGRIKSQYALHGEHEDWPLKELSTACNMSKYFLNRPWPFRNRSYVEKV